MKLRPGSTALLVVVLLAASLLAGCPAYHAPQLSEQLRIEFDDRSWERVYRDAHEHRLIVQYVPSDQSAEDWQEMVMERAFKGLQETTTAEQAMAQDRKLIEGQCKSVEWNVVDEHPGSVLYETTHRECVERQPAYELGRFLVSSKALYQVTYRNKQANLPAAKRQQWIDLLGKVRTVEVHDE